MRWMIAIGVLAGCAQPDSEPCIEGVDCLSPPPPTCSSDAECQPGVCARDSVCHSLDDVRRVETHWTIFGQPASDTTCARAHDLYIRYRTDDPSDQIGFAPVPCRLGQFLLDKAPRRFINVELGVDGFATDVNGGFGKQVKSIDANNVVMFDMQI
jgi:hypothetical protein